MSLKSVWKSSGCNSMAGVYFWNSKKHISGKKKWQEGKQKSLFVFLAQLNFFLVGNKMIPLGFLHGNIQKAYWCDSFGSARLFRVSVTRRRGFLLIGYWAQLLSIHPSTPPVTWPASAVQCRFTANRKLAQIETATRKINPTEVCWFLRFFS